MLSPTARLTVGAVAASGAVRCRQAPGACVTHTLQDCVDCHSEISLGLCELKVGAVAAGRRSEFGEQQHELRIAVLI